MVLGGMKTAGREWRCSCGALLGMKYGAELHIKYKEFCATVRGRASVRCRRCGNTSEHSVHDAGGAARRTEAVVAALVRSARRDHARAHRRAAEEGAPAVAVAPLGGVRADAPAPARPHPQRRQRRDRAAHRARLSRGRAEDLDDSSAVESGAPPAPGNRTRGLRLGAPRSRCVRGAWPRHGPHHGRISREYVPPRDYFEADAHSTDGIYVPRLFLSGDHRLVRARAVAVVGSRAASIEGRAFAAEVACALVKAGFAVMSGLALGIDTAAHRAAIAARGRTIAVIGTPLERAYPPENARLQRDIYEEHLLVSPFAAGTRTHRGHFPARNRVMARLAVATVVAEAGENSGTAHQVRESMACGRPVLVSRAAAQACSWLRSITPHDRLRILERPSDVAALLSRYVV